MSRAQDTEIFNTARSESKTNFDNSQNSYKLAQDNIGNYENQLAKYSAADPFTPGGEFQTSENKVLSGVAGGVADSARAELESSGARRGENPALANAQAESIANDSQRTLAGQEGVAEEQRIGKEADYGKSVLDATQFPVQAETGLYRDASGSGNEQLGTQQRAAAVNQSFGDVFGQSFAQGLGDSLSGGLVKKGMAKIPGGGGGE